MSWPACRVCGEPVEVDEAEAVARTKLEQSMQGTEPAYRVPPDVHRGRCLRRLALDEARAALDRAAALS